MTGSPLIAAVVQVADLRPGVDPLSGAVTADDRRATLGDADACALEHALLAAEAWGGHVLVVAAGPPAANDALRDVLALGAAVVRIPWPVDDEEALNPRHGPAAAAAADDRVLARAVAAIVGSAVLVLCGEHGDDRRSGALPALLAHELGASQALGLVHLAVDGEALLAERRLDRGRRERLRITTPAVCAVEGGARLRRAPLGAALSAAAEPIPVAAHPAAVAGAIRVHGVRADRPRTHRVPPPPGDVPRERLLALTGALVTRDPPTIVGPLDPPAAADALLAYLERHGFLDDTPAQPATGSR